MTSIAITMVVSGLINLDQGIYLTMGSNIGSCVVAVIAGLSSGKNAKRTALMHLMFNCIGVIVFMILGELLIFSTGDISFGSILSNMFPNVPQTQLAMFHTFFNVITVAFMLPLTDKLVKIACKIIPDDGTSHKGKYHLYYLSQFLLSTPALAVAQVKNEIVNMGRLALENLNEAFNMVTTLNFENEESFEEREKELDHINSEIVKYLIKLSNEQLSERDRKFIATSFRSAVDMERIGDYAENIVEYAHSLNDENATFSKEAIDEISKLRDMINNQFETVKSVYLNEDFKELELCKRAEEEIDDFTEGMERTHLTRLAGGKCSENIGAHYLTLATDCERIADHYFNVAKSIKDYATGAEELQ